MVLDTDVFIAALRSKTGASAQLVKLALDGQLEVAATVALILEYEAVALRPEHLLAGEKNETDVRRILDQLVSQAACVETHFGWRPQLRDADDELVLGAAISGGAASVVTFNRRDFLPAASRFGIDVLLPAELLWRLR